MRRWFTIPFLVFSILLAGTTLLLAQQNTPTSRIETELGWWVPSLISVATAVTIFLQVGRWTQKRESDESALLARLESCRKECDTQWEEFREHGSDYAHTKAQESRTELNNALLRVGVDFARKETVDAEFRALRELSTMHNKALCDRLDRIETQLFKE